MTRWYSRFAVVLAVVSLAAPHRSETAEHPDARITALNSLSFQHAAGTHALNVGSAGVLRHLDLEVSADLGWSYRPLGMVDSKSGDWIRSLVEHQETLSLGVALGFYDRVQLSAALPIVLSQKAQLPGRGLGDVDSRGLGDAFVELKFQLLRPKNNLGVALLLPLELPTGNEDAWMGRSGIVFKPAIVISRVAGPSLVSFRFGYNIAPEQTVFDLEDGDRLTGGMAIRWQIPGFDERLDIALGISGHTRVDDLDNGNESAADWNSGLYYDITSSWGIAGIVGGALTQSAVTPALRGLLRVTYTHAFGVHPPDCHLPKAYLADARCPIPDTDKDGVNDAQDKCPDEPEDDDGYQDDDGCPDPDNDQDTILDTKDKCPNEPEDKDGFEDSDGCPDLDNDKDGIPDAKDQCPLKAENVNGLEDEDGCPEPDKDNDGIVDAQDKCPTIAEDKDNFEDDDGCPDLDNDKDGIPDLKDTCPNQPENFNGNKDDDGCPDNVLAVKTKTEIKITEEIHFDHGQVVPKRRSRKVLRAVLRILQRNRDLRVRVEGHTDDLGGQDFNYFLSQARAQAIRDYLVRKSKAADGLDTRLTVMGQGKQKPKSTNQNKKGRARNRRVRFVIVQ